MCASLQDDLSNAQAYQYKRVYNYFELLFNQSGSWSDSKIKDELKRVDKWEAEGRWDYNPEWRTGNRPPVDGSTARERRKRKRAARVRNAEDSMTKMFAAFGMEDKETEAKEPDHSYIKPNRKRRSRRDREDKAKQPKAMQATTKQTEVDEALPEGGSHSRALRSAGPVPDVPDEWEDLLGELDGRDKLQLKMDLKGRHDLTSMEVD